MKYFITEKERNNTLYHEWTKGYFDGVSFWKEDSLLISEDTHYRLGLDKLFQEVILSYDWCGECEVSAKQWEMIMKRAAEVGGEVFECLQEADIWVKQALTEYDIFTMIGM